MILIICPLLAYDSYKNNSFSAYNGISKKCKCKEKSEKRFNRDEKQVGAADRRKNETIE